MFSSIPEVANVPLITGIQDEKGERQQPQTAVRFIMNVIFSFEKPCFCARLSSSIAVAIH